MTHRRINLKRILDDPVLRRQLIKQPDKPEPEKVPEDHWTRRRLLSHPEGKSDPLVGS